MNNFKPAERIHVTEYAQYYKTSEYGGYSYPCDKDGNIFRSELQDAGRASLAECESGIYGEPTFETNTYTYLEPATGTCHCGEDMVLYDDVDANDCPKCGQVWSCFGQEYAPRDQWED